MLNALLEVLDIRSLMVAASFTLIVSAIALVAHWRTTQSFKGLGFIATGFGIEALGVFLLLSRGAVSVEASVFFGNLFVLWGYAGIWIGLLIFWGQSPKFALLISLVLGVLLVGEQYYFFVIDDQLNTRVAFCLGFFALLLFFICVTIVRVIMTNRHVPGTNTRPTYSGLWLVFAAYGMNLLFNFYRAVTWDITGPPDLLFQPSIPAYLGAFGALILSIMVPLGIIIMTSECHEARIKSAVMMDVLTGVFNSHAFSKIASLFAIRADRQGEPYSVLIMDLDKFREIKQRYGVKAGDKVLAAVGRRLKQAKRAQDIVGRLDGHRFIMLLPVTAEKGASFVAERLITAIKARPVYVDGHSIDLTLSVGMTTSEQDGQNLNDALARSERALIDAQRTGGNNFIMA